MKFGISTACFYPMQTESGLLEIAQRGVPYVEVFLDTFSEVKKEFVKELRKTADNYGTRIVSTHPFTSGFEPFMFFTNYERRFEDALELHRHYFEAMNILGSKIFVFHGDRFGSQNPNEMYFERFARLRDVGREQGIIVAQENVERCKSRDIEFLCEMVKYLDNDVSIVFDNKQALRSNISWEVFTQKLYDNIVHIHISDNNDECDCICVGKGQLDASKFVSTYEQKGYEGCMVVELYNEKLTSNEEIFKSFDFLSMLGR